MTINLTTLMVAGSAVTPTVNGGTGLSNPGTSGYILTSNGTIWTSAAPPSTDAVFAKTVAMDPIMTGYL